MDTEQHEGVDPLVERTRAECGAKLTEDEIRALLESGRPYLCSVHAARSTFRRRSSRIAPRSLNARPTHRPARQASASV